MCFVCVFVCKCFYALFGFFVLKIDFYSFHVVATRKDIGRKAISKNFSLVKHQILFFFFSQLWLPH